MSGTGSRCLQAERESLVKLAGMTVSPRIRTHCEDVARVQGQNGSYSIMLGCVLRETYVEGEARK